MPTRAFPRRAQQQQPAPDRVTRMQQMAGSTGPRQPQAGGADKPQQIGEGSDEATRDDQQRVKGYLDKADVAADAEKARPRSDQEARDLQQAEDEGKSHARGER